MTFYDISHLDSVRSALNIQASGQPLRKGHYVKVGGPRIKSSLRRSPCDITSPAGKTTFLLPKILFQTSGYSSGAEVKVRFSIETREKPVTAPPALGLITFHLCPPCKQEESVLSTRVGEGGKDSRTQKQTTFSVCTCCKPPSPPPLDPPCSFGIARGRSPKREVQLIERAEPKYPPFSLSDRNVRKQFGEIVSRSPPPFFCRPLSVFFWPCQQQRARKG